MTSTDIDAELEEALVDFYQKKILPICSKVPGGAFDRGTLAHTETSFVARRVSRMSAANFELRMGDEPQIIATLRACWKDTPLEDIPEPLLKLARRFEKSEQQSRVSAFVYEMF
jgi:hypothetical protein